MSVLPKDYVCSWGENLAPIVQIFIFPTLDVRLAQAILRFTSVDASPALGILMFIRGVGLVLNGRPVLSFPALDVRLAQAILRFTRVDVSLALIILMFRAGGQPSTDWSAIFIFPRP